MTSALAGSEKQLSKLTNASSAIEKFGKLREETKGIRKEMLDLGNTLSKAQGKLKAAETDFLSLRDAVGNAQQAYNKNKFAVQALNLELVNE